LKKKLFKKNIILGKRIFLKYFLKKDITKFYINALNDPQLTKYSRQKYIFHKKSNCIHYLNSFKKSKNLFLKIVCKKTNKFIGTTTIYFSDDNMSADIGIFIMNKNFHRLGYATEVYKLLTNFLFDNSFKVEKITAGTSINNKAMIKVLKKAAFKLDKKKKIKISNNRLVNSLFFYKLKK